MVRWLEAPRPPHNAAPARNPPLDGSASQRTRQYTRAVAIKLFSGNASMASDHSQNNGLNASTSAAHTPAHRAAPRRRQIAYTNPTVAALLATAVRFIRKGRAPTGNQEKT